MRSKKELEDLLEKYKADKCTAEELSLLSAWYHEIGKNAEPLSMTDLDRFRMLERFKQLADFPDANNPTIARRIVPLYSRWYFKVASVMLIITAGLGYHFLQKSDAQVVAKVMQDAMPGTNKAILKLAGGEVINLDAAANGKLAQESGATISKTSDGQLKYTYSKADKGSVGFNSIVTPKGGHYSVVLADGTKVWLNAGSSLRFPSSFTERHRTVFLTGEAYFEVTKQNHQPFLVESNGQVVKVLGTHFNVNAYANEGTIKTTLLEGSVRLTETTTHQSRLLQPGQASSISNASIHIASASVGDAIAWKNGLFRFHDTDLKTLLRQLERWYDIEADMTGLPDLKFNAEISRNVKLSHVLKMIAVTSNVKFELKGRRLVMVQ